MKKWIGELKKELKLFDVANDTPHYSEDLTVRGVQTMRKLIAEIENLEALHVTKRAVAMARVCKAAREIDLKSVIDCILSHIHEFCLGDEDKEYYALIEKVKKLQQVLREYDEVR